LETKEIHVGIIVLFLEVATVIDHSILGIY
jgi:hypothetical protein